MHPHDLIPNNHQNWHLRERTSGNEGLTESAPFLFDRTLYDIQPIRIREIRSLSESEYVVQTSMFRRHPREREGHRLANQWFINKEKRLCEGMREAIGESTGGNTFICFCSIQKSFLVSFAEGALLSSPITMPAFLRWKWTARDVPRDSYLFIYKEEIWVEHECIRAWNYHSRRDSRKTWDGRAVGQTSSSTPLSSPRRNLAIICRIENIYIICR